MHAPLISSERYSHRWPGRCRIMLLCPFDLILASPVLEGVSQTLVHWPPCCCHIQSHLVALQMWKNTTSWSSSARSFFQQTLVVVAGSTNLFVLSTLFSTSKSWLKECLFPISRDVACLICGHRCWCSNRPLLRFGISFRILGSGKHWLHGETMRWRANERVSNNILVTHF